MAELKVRRAIRGVAISDPDQVLQPAADDPLTAAEARDLERLEGVVRGALEGHVAGVRALYEIRERRLYRAAYTTFDEYVELCFRKTRQWATREINWLKVRELLAESGKEVELTVADANILKPLCCYPNAIVEALGEAEEEASRQAAGKKRKPRREILQEVVERRREYLKSMSGRRCSYSEYRMVDDLCGKGATMGLTAKAHRQAERQGRSPKTVLIELCMQQKTVPDKQELIEFARGDDLRELVQALTPLQAQWTRERDLITKRDRLQKQQREIEEKIDAAATTDATAEAPESGPPESGLQQPVAYDVRLRLLSPVDPAELKEDIAEGLEYLGTLEKITIRPYLTPEQRAEAQAEVEAFHAGLLRDHKLKGKATDLLAATGEAGADHDALAARLWREKQTPATQPTEGS